MGYILPKDLEPPHYRVEKGKRGKEFRWLVVDLTRTGDEAITVHTSRYQFARTIADALESRTLTATVEELINTREAQSHQRWPVDGLRRLLLTK